MRRVARVRIEPVCWEGRVVITNNAISGYAYSYGLDGTNSTAEALNTTNKI